MVSVTFAGSVHEIFLPGTSPSDRLAALIGIQFRHFAFVCNPKTFFNDLLNRAL